MTRTQGRFAFLAGHRGLLTRGNLLLSFVLCSAIHPIAAQDSVQDPLLRLMNGIAQRQLEKRASMINAIQAVSEAEVRKQEVRKKLLDSLGGLPEYKGALNARITGQIRAGSYIIEKLIYESLPGLYVTANLYRPNQPGRYPAVLLQSGHTQEGKAENQRLAANLAMKGFVVLCFDPIGQGERVQTYSRQLDAPLLGWSVPEHIEMGAQSQLIGQSLARYFIWDAMRSIDYLVTRPDVDSSRIGAAGCSGGGALTTFIAALDPRVKAVVAACYPASFQALFPHEGPDVEMVLPHLLASGLDTADFVELSAPTPWMLQATTADEYHFSEEGVRLVYNEAQKWYALYGCEKNVAFLVGPGPHGMPLVSREALYEWMIRWLNGGRGDFHEQAVKMYSNSELQVTASGNVENEPHSRKLYQLLASDLEAHRHHGTIAELLAELQGLRISTDRSAPHFKVLKDSNNGEIRREEAQIESDPGIWLNTTLYLPASPGRKPAVILVKGRNHVGLMPTGKIAEQMVRRGRVVLELEPRQSNLLRSEKPFAGDWTADLHANVIGRNLPAWRAHDILRGVDLLASRADVDAGDIRAAAHGVEGIWLLLAAAADSRISRIWLDRTPYSLSSALENSIASDLWDAVIPGFVLGWDLSDLRKAMGKRGVLWTDPTNWMDRIIPLGPSFEYRYVPGDSTDLADDQDREYIAEFLN